MSRRRCTKPGCGKTLAGKRGHGFPTSNGRDVHCGDCAYPAKKPPRVHVPAEDYS